MRTIYSTQPLLYSETGQGLGVLGWRIFESSEALSLLVGCAGVVCLYDIFDNIMMYTLYMCVYVCIYVVQKSALFNE